VKLNVKFNLNAFCIQGMFTFSEIRVRYEIPYINKHKELQNEVIHVTDFVSIWFCKTV
jgi:hypothetical protein